MREPVTRPFLASAALLFFACTKESPPPAPVPGPDVVAIVLGHWITRSELGTRQLEELINPPLYERFAQENGITATEEEIRGFLKFFSRFHMDSEGEVTEVEPRDPDMKEIDDQRREMAKYTVLEWKTDRKLYEMYGGDVIFQQANPLEPVGAYRKFLEGEERAGRFKILDPVLAQSYWAYYRQENRIVYDPSEVDYSVPWWANARKNK